MSKLPQVQPNRNKIEQAVYISFVKYKINSSGRLRVEGDWAIIQLAIRNALKRTKGS